MGIAIHSWTVEVVTGTNRSRGLVLLAVIGPMRKLVCD
jgi:hypothetical protein